MALSITHTHVATGADAGNGEVHKAEWNAEHSITGTLSADDVVDGTTNKVFTSAEKSKLSGIATGAEVNVQSDWNAASGDAYILNKPTLGTAAAASTGDFAATNLSNVSQSDARAKVGTGTMAYINVTISTSDPSGGVDGEAWWKTT